LKTWALKVGGTVATPLECGSCQKLEEAGKGFSPRASKGSMILLAPQFLPSETDVRFLTSRTVREYISVALGR
jgi:hypothetical protein